MDPHLLRTFVTVAEHASFSAAATHLGYTQSAVSQHIAALEADLGTQLLHRRPVTPTPAGRRLLEHAAPILLRISTARADLQRLAATLPTTLIVAITPLSDVAKALAVVRRLHPGTDVHLTVCPRDAVVAGVADGSFSLGLVDGVAAPSDPLNLAVPLRTTALTHQPLAVALPNNHPLASRTGLSLHDLADARWIDAPDVAAPLTTLRAATDSDAFRCAFTYTGTDLHTLLTLIAAGHGLAVLPASVTTRGVATIPVTTPRLVHRTELLHGALPDAAAAALTAALT
ncbi:LysR family transcriptional regulator [Kribbella sp. NPDC026611]|uniref:LysR family transcriptional regulator n=1 Tax=Kribbella sp. NPDC026611 TaxID=3154911 RepID=UPI0033EB5260